MGNKQYNDHIITPINGDKLIEGNIDFATAKKRGLIQTIESQNDSKLNNFQNNSKENIISEVMKKTINTDISYIFDGYDKETILDVFEDKAIVSIICETHLLYDKPTQLAKLLPKSDRPLIFYYTKARLDIFKLLLPSLNCNALKNNLTILFYLDMSHIIEVLRYCDNFNVNHEQNGSRFTFLEKMIASCQIEYSSDNLTTLFELLKKHKYNFNHLSYNKMSFFTMVLYKKSYILNIMLDIIKFKDFDISVDSEWIHYLIRNNKLKELHDVMCHMYARQDYHRLFIGFYNNLYIHTWDDEFISFLKKCYFTFENRTIDALKYADENGNTLFHHMAMKHDKKHLQFAYTHFSKNPELFELRNKDDKTAKDLFTLSKF